MAEERDPIYRWIGAHQGWAFAITIAFVVCVLVTVAGFAFVALAGVVDAPAVTRSP